MEEEMRKSGSKIPDMIDALKKAGWTTFEHHDNWIKKEWKDNPENNLHEMGKSLNEAYREICK